MEKKIIFNKKNIKKIIILNLIIIIVFLIPISLGTTKVPSWWRYISWLYSEWGIVIFILVLIGINIIASINCHFFQYINKNKRKIIEKLIEQNKPITTYALIKKVEGLPEATGYRNIDKLIKGKTVSKDKDGKLYLDEENKRHLKGTF